MTEPNYSLFVIASLILLITPGPAVLYIVARSIEQGTRAGIVSALGMQLGGLVHVMGAAVGVSALLMSSAIAFAVLKYIGAGYLIFIGVKTLISARNVQTLTRVEDAALQRVFREAVVVQIFNPKAAMFFFAFLPQFVSPSKGPVYVQLVALGVAYMAMAFATDCAYAAVAGRMSGWLRTSRKALRIQRQAAGATYIGLGLLTATSGTAPE